MPQRRDWTEKEIASLRNEFRRVPDRLLAKRLGRTVRAVTGRASRLGLARTLQRRWTDEEDEIIRSVVRDADRLHYHRNPLLPVLAERLGRNPSDVSSRAKKIGFPIGRGKSSGRHSGRKVSHWKRGKNGGVPVYEHVAVMERHLGRALKDGECVHHIDCDKDNNELDNLYLCRSRSEHRRIHHQLNDLAAELLRRGIIRFNRVKGLYELCETSS